MSNAPSRPGAPPTSAIIGRIERELFEIWSTPAGPGEVPKSRAVTMNLVVMGTPEIADRYTAVVDEVTRSIPARAIVIALDPESLMNELSGDVTAVCSPGDGGAVVCSERVRLKASGNVCARVGSAVEALCVPEIPTSLVWLGRIHVDDPVFLAVAGEAQRILLDTEYTSFSSLLNLARWTREDRSRPHLADLAWTRISLWQELCARFFDEPGLREMAHKITKVTIHQASDKGARLGSEGALLLGWLATRLGWKTSRMGGALRFKRVDGQYASIQLGVVARPAGVAPAALAGVSIEAHVDGKHVKGSITRELASGPEGSLDADVLVWRMETETNVPLEHRVRLSANQGAKVLERTLHRPAEDPALTEAVAFAEEVFEDGVTCG